MSIIYLSIHLADLVCNIELLLVVVIVMMMTMVNLAEVAIELGLPRYVLSPNGQQRCAGEYNPVSDRPGRDLHTTE